MAALSRKYSILGFSICLSILVVLPAILWAQAENEPYDFWLSKAFVTELADKNTIDFPLTLKLTDHTKSVHTLGNDCEIHIAAASTDSLAWPGGIVVEPPNLCKERGPGMAASASEKKLREILWPKYLDNHVMNKSCVVEGFPRIFTEHAAGNADPANPNHVLEIHPALKISTGSFMLDMQPFVKVYPGMRQIQAKSAMDCIKDRKLYVRQVSDGYRFREEGGGPCGNFAVLEAAINKDWVRQINGGHSAIARVSAGGFDPSTLKIYTLSGTPEDALLQQISQGQEPDRRLYFHGLFTYDYFSILKVLRSHDGNWTDVPNWTEVNYPLALVVLGETSETGDDQ